MAGCRVAVCGGQVAITRTGLSALFASSLWLWGGSGEAAPRKPFPFTSTLNSCLSLPSGATSNERAACMAFVVQALEHGLNYQRCRWRIVLPEPRSACAVEPEDTGAPVDCRDANRSAVAGERCEVIASGLELLEHLRTTDANEPAKSAVLAQEFLQRVQGGGGYTLVSQGGVSLGSWQAGYAYIVTERLKHARGTDLRPVYRTVAGASAGAVNALAFGLEGCRANARAPEDTLAWKVWVEHLRLFAGKDDRPGLLDSPAEGTEGLALFSDAPLQAAMDDARRELAATAGELTQTCAFDLGFVTTHLTCSETPIHVRVDRGDVRQSVTAPRASERFAVGVHLNPGSPSTSASVTFRNLFQLPASHTSDGSAAIPDEAFFAQLGLDAAPRRDDVLEGIRASGAFPFAFPPVQLEYRTYDAAARRFLPKSGSFVDGGVLENTPLGLAVAVNRRRASLRDNPWFGDLDSAADTYVYISPGVHSWSPEYRGLPGKSAPSKRSPLGVYFDWLSDVAGAGSMARLSQATEEYPFLREDRDNDRTPPRMVVPVRSLPIMGDQLGHFFAFTEREFRVFDYVVGMVDADENFTRIVPGAPTEFSLPKSKRENTDHLPEKYACVKEFYAQCIHGQGKLAADCGEPTLPGSCQNDATGPRFRALLKANWRFRRWIERGKPGKNKDELSVFLRMLTSEKFDFQDAPDGWKASLADGDGARFTRRLAGVALDRLTAREGWFARKSMRAGGRIVADAALYREFPDFLVQIGYPERGLEAGLSFKLADWGQHYGLRLGFLGRAYNYRSHYVFRPAGEHFHAKFLSLDALAEATFILSPWTPGIADLELSAGPIASYRRMPWYDDGHWVFRRYGGYLSATVVLLQRLYLRGENQLFLWTDLNNYFRGTTQEDNDSYRLQISLGLRFF